MYVKPTDPEHRNAIRSAILAWLARSRFTARVCNDNHPRWKQCVRIEGVRKRNKGFYCGQHPCACQANPFVRRRRISSYCLEGADWIGFNDGLNDVLDNLDVAADVWSFNREARSGRFFIRKGRRRRVHYAAQEVHAGVRAFYHWHLGDDGDFEDWVGRMAPRSSFPEGTPGLPDWMIQRGQGGAA